MTRQIDLFLYFCDLTKFSSEIFILCLALNFLREITSVRFFRLSNNKKIKAVKTKLEKIYCDDLGSLTGDRSENISRLALLRSALCISKDRYLIRSARRSAEAEAVGDLLASLPKVWVWKIHCVQSHLGDFSDPSLHCCKSIRKHCQIKMSALEQLKKSTLVVADTGDFEAIAKFKPQVTFRFLSNNR